MKKENKNNAFIFSWYCCECVSKSDMEEKKLLNKNVILFPLRRKSILVAS